MSKPSPLSLIAALLVLSLLSGCGQNGGSGSTPPTSQPPTLAVSIQTDTASYLIGSIIKITLKNQGQQEITFSDHHTNCTIVILEKQGSNGWEMVAPCRLQVMTRQLSLPAGKAQEVQLIPAGQWAAGKYRARFDYSLKVADGRVRPATVYSSVFQVG